MNTKFTKLLLAWDKKSNFRKMPWKAEKDPYKIWLSEIILQQTRVEQGLKYYEKFISNYPSIQDLAIANEDQVFKLWEGLGYYNRCRNLIYTAKYIVKELNGKFPNQYQEILKLKGVGPYTAAAIASFAYNLPYAVVDGNVFRVFARYYGIHTPIDTKEGLLEFNEIAKLNLATEQAGIYNQALMDFGATVCKPMSPLCSECTLKNSCEAFLQQKVGQLPLKLKVIEKKIRYFDYFIFSFQGKVLIQKRAMGDIWAGLFQFYLVENDKMVSVDTTYFEKVLTHQLLIEIQYTVIEKEYRTYQQQLTHQLLTIRFFTIHLNSMPKIFEKGIWVLYQQLKDYALPKSINTFLKDENLTT